VQLFLSTEQVRWWTKFNHYRCRFYLYILLPFLYKSILYWCKQLQIKEDCPIYRNYSTQTT